MKLIIFDCDGTLADSQNAIVAAMAQAFDRHGLAAPARADVLSVVGLSLSVAIAGLRPDDATADEIAAIAEDYKKAFHDLRRDPAFSEPLFPGVRELITGFSARDDIALAVATGKSMRGLTTLLAREGIADHFVSLQTADHHPSKPDPAMIHAALAEIGVEAEDAVMVGDTTFDVMMAAAAGVLPIGVSWGYHAAEDLTAVGAGRVAHAAHEVAAHVDDHFSQRSAA